MGEYRLSESLWRRGWRDTWAGWKNPLFGILDAVGCVLVGAFLGWYWGLGLFIFALFCVWVSATARAPVKQRNEARNLLEAKPKPMPLQNRKELRGAVASVESTTVQLVNKKNELAGMDSQNPYLAEVAMSADKAYDLWNESMNELRRQYLVAGGLYESICIELTGFIWMQVAIMMGYAKPPEDFKPSTLQDTLQFVGLVGGRVGETLRRIDEASGQVVDKEGSQI